LPYKAAKSRFCRDLYVDDPTAITPKTEYSACFKFKLTEVGSVSGITRYGGVDPLTARLQGVVAEEVGKVLDKKLGRDDDDDKPNNFMDGVIGLVNQPDKLIAVLQGLRGMFMPADAAGYPAAAYGAVSGGLPINRAGSTAVPRPMAAVPQPVAQPVAQPAQELPADTEETMNRVAAALDRLDKADPNALENLEKLAELAETQPAIYKMAVAQLNSLSK
jgi:hypothetical protein